MIGIYFFVLSVVSFADTSCACNSPRFDMSVIFLILMLPSTSAKISFSNSQLISEVIFLFTAKISNALCWSKTRHTKSFFTSITRGIKPCIIRKLFLQEFSCRNYPPPPRPLLPWGCRAELVTMTNQPIPRRWTTSFAFFQAKHFFFSSSWEYWWLPIWWKTLNPKGFPAKYRYQGGLDVVYICEKGMIPNERK